MEIDINKKYRTRSGLEVRIYATDGCGKTPVHGAVLEKGEWKFAAWSIDGKYPFPCANYDLIEVKPRIKRTVWVNVYADRNSSLFKTKEQADKLCQPDRLACVKVEIDCEEGEGL